MKTKSKRLLSTLLAVMMVFSLFAAMPIQANAALGVPETRAFKKWFTTGNGDEIQLPDDITIGDPGEGKNGLDITRSVTLDLNGKTLEITTTSKDTNGIKIASGITLTIKDSDSGGKLIVNNTYITSAHANGYGAGINTTEGTLVILGGAVTVVGGYNAAGIGGGRANTSGNVTISGGMVTATGGNAAAGIGGGAASAGGITTISGGTVTATGGYGGGAGIGGGNAGGGGTIIISGGTVTSTGGYAGSGIGAGIYGTGGTATISGGIVMASGGDYGVGIGGGSTTNPLILKITGGNIVPLSGTNASHEDDSTAVATNGSNTVSRVDVTVIDGANNAVAGAELSVNSYKALTDGNGKATIWIPAPAGKEVTATKSGLPTTAASISAAAPFAVNIKMAIFVNSPPNLKSGVSATATKSVMVNTAYTLDLSTIFEDANAGDALTYKVSIDGGASVTAEQNYSYTPTAEGTKILIFKANDGTVDSTDTYTVALTATATSSTGMSNFTKVKAYTRGQFTDVDETLWYGLDEQEVIANAYEYGLMKGDSSTTFNPAGNMTIAEAIAVAARVHKIYATGNGDFEQGSVWYQVYVDYAVANNIIAANDFANYSKAATRAEMAYIFSESLPAAEFPSQNTVNSLPDVNNGTPYYSAILTLYKAGVLAGSDAQGTFNPSNNIIRAEAAAIISRVILPATRFSGKTF